MKLNALKPSVLSYTRKATWLYVSYVLESENIPRNESQRDLGVIFDPKLTFHLHVEKIVVDCNRYLGVLYRLLYSFDSWAPLKTLFLALVLSRITFASVVWAGCASYLV